MKLFLALFFAGVIVAPCFAGEAADLVGIDIVEVSVEPATRTILCESGRYSSRDDEAARQLAVVNCTTRHNSPPACQTKIEERVTGEGESMFVVWKNCKTENSCSRNAERFNPRDCVSDLGTKNFRICVSCCGESGCNDNIDIDDIAATAQPPAVADDQAEDEE